jgi:hypothetical protein
VTNQNHEGGEPDVKRNQPTHGQPDDDPRQAKESGDPLAEGRLRGRPIDEDTSTGKAGGDSKDWESGRHQAI